MKKIDISFDILVEGRVKTVLLRRFGLLTSLLFKYSRLIFCLLRSNVYTYLPLFVKNILIIRVGKAKMDRFM